MTLKNEPPTPKKIRDAYKKGNVPHSRELVSTANFIVSVSMVLFLFDFYVDTIMSIFYHALNLFTVDIHYSTNVMFAKIFYDLTLIILPLLAINFFVTVLVSILNTGLVISFQVLKPDITRISPAQGFSRIFSKKNLVEFIKSCLKISILGYLVYGIVWDSIPMTINATYCGLPCIMSTFRTQIVKIIVMVSGLFVALSIFDVAFQHWHYIKQLYMSYDEIKKEHKETEGDPMIKMKRQQLHQELSVQNVINNVKKSSVIIANPTHLVVGLFYEKNKNMLPIIQFKGADLLVKFILEVAKQNDIPVVQNVPLARALYECQLFSYIPSELIVPVAKIIKWVLDLQSKKEHYSE